MYIYVCVCVCVRVLNNSGWQTLNYYSVHCLCNAGADVFSEVGTELISSIQP